MRAAKGTKRVRRAWLARFPKRRAKTLLSSAAASFALAAAIAAFLLFAGLPEGLVVPALLPAWLFGTAVVFYTVESREKEIESSALAQPPAYARRKTPTPQAEAKTRSTKPRPRNAKNRAANRGRKNL